MKAHQYIRAEQRRFRRAAEGRAWSVKELPQYYYHKTFCDMISYVGTRHTSLMDIEHTQFIRDFEALSFEAQCAYARLAGRKGRVFNKHHLHYNEIDDLQAQFEVLREAKFVRTVTEKDFRAYLNALNKADLVDLMHEELCETLFKKSWKKARLIDVAFTQIDFDALSIPSNIIVQARIEVFHYLLFLYFGKIESNLQSKTLGALGLVRPASSDEKRTTFKTRDIARSRYFYETHLKSTKEEFSQNFSCLTQDIEAWPEAVDDLTKIKRKTLLQKLGQISERQGDIDTALSIYDRVDDDYCNERVVRLRYKRNMGEDKHWVQNRLEEMIENPESDHEHAFAQDFYARKFNQKRTSLVTDMLRKSDVVYLDEAFKNSPERATTRYFKEKGLEAFRTENRLWRTLFGLLFWEQLFEGKTPQRWSLPDRLKTHHFYEAHKAAIEDKLALLSDRPATMLRLLKIVTAYFRVENGVFLWGDKSTNDRTLDQIKALLTNAPQKAVGNILRLMAQQYTSLKDGFPDLMVIKEGQVRFVEVKAEGDVLRRNQLTRLRQLKNAGFQADILRVAWHIDPNQTYVVVDVETTGGRAGLHRVTEIGAVKIQGGKIIDEWQSLINPQRSIPPMITKITGIDEAMVAGAPIFAEIADSFSDFMGDAIFAAHNVNFDYGFISTEFQMIDRKFRHPKICTCASMRKLYPGYRSYGLKNLCHEFEIDLKSHHRALCDAKAAAQLLLLVNDRRIDAQSLISSKE